MAGTRPCRGMEYLSSSITDSIARTKYKIHEHTRHSNSQRVSNKTKTKAEETSVEIYVNVSFVSYHALSERMNASNADGEMKWKA